MSTINNSNCNSNGDKKEQGRESMRKNPTMTPEFLQQSPQQQPSSKSASSTSPKNNSSNSNSNDHNIAPSFSAWQAAQRQQQEILSDLNQNQKNPKIYFYENFRDWMQPILQNHTTHWGKDWKVVTAGGAAVVLAWITSPPGRFVTRWFLQQLWWIGGTMIGTALGIGLGLGLATHVYEQLQDWEQSKSRSMSQQQSSSPMAGAITTANSNNMNNNKSQRNIQQMIRQRSMMSFLPSSASSAAAIPTTSVATSSTAAVLQDQQTYHSLMVSAGYHTPRFLAAADHNNNNNNNNPQQPQPLLPLTTTLRGQVLRQLPEHPLYRFQTSAQQAFQELWPTMHSAIQQQLGQAVEYILRDFVGIWYWKMDSSLINPSPPPEAAATTTTDETNSQQPQSSQSPQSAPAPQRHMLYSVAPYKPIPFLDALYESCTMIFGNLALRVEHNVNVPQLLLLQWTQVLAHTFKWYRTLRKAVLIKQQMHQQHHQGHNETTTTTTQPPQSQPPSAPAAGARLRQSLRDSLTRTSTSHMGHTTNSNTTTAHDATAESSFSKTASFVPVSEMAMTKEFLFANKLHPAVTFGLDVPSLLFADLHGRECGRPLPKNTSTTTTQNNNAVDDDDDDDAVLAARLWDTDLIRDCELDYNRVVGHRMVRALLLRPDFSCRIVSSMLTEILGGCVLTPIMGLFTPEYLNSWLISGLDKSNSSSSDSDTTAEPTEHAAGEETSAGNGREDPFDVAASAHGAVELEFTPPSPSHSVERTTLASSPTIDSLHGETTTTTAAEASSQSEHGTTSMAATTSSAVVDSLSSSPKTSLLSVEENITAMLTLALMDLQHYLDVEELRAAAASVRDSASPISTTSSVDWDHPGCRSAVVRLVLVLEAALTHGRCTYHAAQPQREPSTIIETDDDGEDLNSIVTENYEGDHQLHSSIVDEEEESEQQVEITLPEYESANFTQILMEITSDIEAFEERIELENNDNNNPDSHATNTSLTVQKRLDGLVAEPYQPTSSEQSTLRTLLAAWLHTGQVYRTIHALVQANDTILAPYYDRTAFLRTPEHSRVLVRQLRTLSGVDIMVDTMAVLASPRLNELGAADLSVLVEHSAATMTTTMTPTTPKRSLIANTTAAAAAAPASLATPMLSTMANTLLSSSSAISTPRYLDFHRNESFAASLRSERERRRQSWERLAAEDSAGVAEGVPMICRPGNQEVHADLHHLARIFYAGTNLMALRDAARRRSGGSAVGESSVDATNEEGGGVPVSLIVVETACPRRRIEVPDDDSSFLLRAQPRPLNAVGVHRDQRQHEQSFKCFAATYEEPALPVGSDHFSGGRYIRRCLVRYYPIDRTASIALQNDPRRLDQRKHRGAIPDTITLDQQSSRQMPFLSTEFLKERHLCQRWIPKGTTRSQSLLASSVMEPTDFTATPRTGKALDFVYRCSLYERPMLDLGGKHFTAHDSAALGVHRADASALELSDASLSAALLTLGQADDDSIGDTNGAGGGGEGRAGFEFDKDGYPVLWMKFSRSKQDDTRVEVKPYRTSFVRAALMITSARQEAQQSCLIKCVKAGSAKKATKGLIDTYLRRTLRLLEYAGSSSREKESTLLRDLKLGVNHIDRSQLRRNALLSPRYPTELLDLTASVEDAVQSTDVKGVDIFGTATTVFKIKVSATIALAATDEEMLGDSSYLTADGSLAKTYQEEWVVYRSLKEFQLFHKHLKNEVSVAESSGTAGSRLVGAAAAAFAATTAAQHRSRQRKMLIPSLSQASKTGALGITKNVILKRKELLSGYVGYLLSPGHLLGRCSEWLLFLGAAFPLPPAVRVGETIEATSDPLGRTDMTRTVLQLRVQPITEEPALPVPSRNRRANSNGSDEFQDDDLLEDDDESDQIRKSERMIPLVRNKIDKVPLPQVRKQLFELLRYQFGFDNASFVRNRMLAALKTASFAVTSGAEFRKKLYQLHVKHVNSEAVAGLIEMLCGILWPDGIFFVSKPPTPEEELQRQAQKSKELLHSSFPDQVRTILGQELTRDGIEIFHEMLQNRIVVKSMAYMFFDLLWVEVFPELGDVMPGGAALDIDSQK